MVTKDIQNLHLFEGKKQNSKQISKHYSLLARSDSKIWTLVETPTPVIPPGTSDEEIIRISKQHAAIFSRIRHFQEKMQKLVRENDNLKNPLGDTEEVQNVESIHQNMEEKEHQRRKTREERKYYLQTLAEFEKEKCKMDLLLRLRIVHGVMESDKLEQEKLTLLATISYVDAPNLVQEETTMALDKKLTSMTKKFLATFPDETEEGQQ